MMRLDDKIGNFAVNSTITFYGVALLDIFSKEEGEVDDDWYVSTYL